MSRLLAKTKATTSICRQLTSVKDFCTTACRTYLSKDYDKAEGVKKLFEVPANESEIALQCLAVDRCHERNLPVTSLTLDRVIRSINAKEHVEGMKYYLNKFRHSENGYYLHPSTVFIFSKKCLQLSKDTLLDMLDHKAQFGIFPNNIIFNQLLDEYLMQHNLEGAMRALKEIFLLEMLDNKTTQALALKALTLYWQQKSAEMSVIPEFDDAEIKRNVAGALFIIGKHLKNPSFEIIGLSLLGTVESEHGVGAVYQNPWGPLHWEPNNLEQAIRALQDTTQPVSKQSTDILLHCVANDEQLLERTNDVLQQKLAQNMVKTDDSLTLDGVANSVTEQLPQFEAEDRKALNRDVSEWLDDRQVYTEAEEELKVELRKEREQFYSELNLERQAHEQAVAELGYWSMKRPETTEEEDKARPRHLQKEYIEGCIMDLDIVERVREKRGTKKNPIILFD